ncbi:MAG: type II toxin-antitoxin system VapB family antitoxin [Rhodoferax sp.]
MPEVERNSIRTTIAIDDDLLAKAEALTGLSETTALGRACMILADTSSRLCAIEIGVLRAAIADSIAKLEPAGCSPSHWHYL